MLQNQHVLSTFALQLQFTLLRSEARWEEPSLFP